MKEGSQNKTSREGKVYLVGAGPGDPELVTLKARRLLETCDVVVYDYLVAPELLGWVRPEAVKVCVGKRAGFHSRSQVEIEQLLKVHAEAGCTVVRLKGGDPFLFGRGGEEALSLRRSGIEYEVVPAVTAALGAAAYAGAPVTFRGISATAVFVSGHEDPTKRGGLVEWEKLGGLSATLCIYMGMGRLAEICQRLVAGGRAISTPVTVVQWATTERQRTCSGLLSNIVERVETERISSPAVIIVGEVARLAGELGWFGAREADPLFIDEIRRALPA